MQKELLISEIMLKRITTKESDIVNPLMESKSFNPKVAKAKGFNMY
jgi:hypothetical protein